MWFFDVQRECVQSALQLLETQQRHCQREVTNYKEKLYCFIVYRFSEVTKALGRFSLVICYRLETL